MRVAVFGLGEAGALYAADLVEAGADVHGFDPAPVDTPPGVLRHEHPDTAVADAAVIMAFTAAADASTAIAQALDAIPPPAIYADCATGSSSLKERLAATAADAGFAFVDVALMAPVPGSGIRTPALASGSGAARFATLMAPLGMTVTDDGPQAGRAAARKLLRSVVMKGMAALIIESMEAADAAGLVEETWTNVVAQFTAADEAFVRRLVEGTAPHATRRLHEMEATAELLADLGVDPVMTRATVESLRRIDAGDGRIPRLP